MTNHVRTLLLILSTTSSLLLVGCVASDDDFLVGMPIVTEYQTNAGNDSKFEKALDWNLVGCWSNGSGEVLRIGAEKMAYGFVRTSRADSPEPVRFIVLEPKDGISSLIQLESRPQFFRFSEFVSIRYEGLDDIGYESMSVESFVSFSDYQRAKFSGRSGWVKDKCEFFPKWYNELHGF